MNPPLSLSAMIEALFGVRTTYAENPLNNQVQVAVTQLLPGNPKRVGVVMVNLSVNTIWVAPNNRVATTLGIRLAANGGSMTLTWDKDFEIISMPWYGMASNINSEIYVIEYISR